MVAAITGAGAAGGPVRQRAAAPAQAGAGRRGALGSLAAAGEGRRGRGRGRGPALAVWAVGVFHITPAGQRRKRQVLPLLRCYSLRNVRIM